MSLNRVYLGHNLLLMPVSCKVSMFDPLLINFGWFEILFHVESVRFGHVMRSG